MKSLFYSILPTDRKRDGIFMVADKNREAPSFKDGESLDDLEPLDLVLVSGEYTHYVFGPGAANMVSHELMLLLKEYINDPSSVDFVPVKVFSKEYGDRTYYIVHFNIIYDVIDIENSRSIPSTGSITMPCIDCAKAKGLEVFNSRPMTGHLFVSHKVKREIVRRKLDSGIEFWAVMDINCGE